MPAINSILQELGFKETFHVLNRASIADLISAKKRCGIYVLHFSNDQYYAGQAVDVTRRYVQHSKNHLDIEKISFKEVPQNELNAVEREVIRKLEAEKFRLRNISLVSLPDVPNGFDAIMSRELQEKWLTDVSFMSVSGKRAENADWRDKYQHKYERLKQLPYAEEIIDVLREYVRVGIPEPLLTEMCFWSCSCLPPHRVAAYKLYSRINIYSQEVFTVGTIEGEPFFSWHLAKSFLQTNYGIPFLQPRFKSKYRKNVEDHTYIPGGQDQTNFSLDLSANEALEQLQDKRFILAIRKFNIGLMRKGPNINSKSHCLQLADELLKWE